MKFTPHVFGDLAIKGDTVAGIDWVEQTLSPWFEGCSGSVEHWDILDRLLAGEQSPPLDLDCAGRDASFEDGQLFAVFDARDLDTVIARLQLARREGYPTADHA
ncbi:hypothetical protein [Sphingomonas koreensis]|nr:hypothetical protein [Sphingomonas koreensis]MDC7809934.1 hypothetical protein [Sphingomonas koreensis]